MVPVIEGGDIKGPVFAGMDMLTSVSDITSLENNPAIDKARQELHAVGLGAMNLNGLLAKNNIRFEDEETKDLVRTFFMMMNYYSIMRSAEIAQERGIVFAGFEHSEYANGNYFEKYITEEFFPRTEKIQEMFAGIEIPTIADWMNLKAFVQTHGLYHAYRLAIAPTQSISYIQNSTSSVMPVVDVIERRKYANATTVYPMPYLNEESYYAYKSAYDMNQLNVIDVIAEIQPHIDQGISTILYVNSDVATNELARYYIYAQKKGLKSLYYTRTRNLQVDECLACSV
jgi:ribonucleoside-diphosphate reductase alpha chain